MDRVRIGLLGGFAVSVGDRPVPAAAWERRSSSAVVKLLTLAPGRALHRDQVAVLRRGRSAARCRSAAGVSAGSA